MAAEAEERVRGLNSHFKPLLTRRGIPPASSKRYPHVHSSFFPSRRLHCYPLLSPVPPRAPATNTLSTAMAALASTTLTQSNVRANHGRTTNHLARARATALRAPARPTIPARQRVGHLALTRGVNLNTDISRVAEFKRHEKDSGSSEVQIALLTSRVAQLTAHLKENRKDYACQRGLQQILARRKKLMKYLFSNDRAAFDRVVAELGIREKLSKQI